MKMTSSSSYFSKARFPLEICSRISLLYFLYKIYTFFKLYSNSHHTHRRLLASERVSKPTGAFSSYMVNDTDLWLFTKKWIPKSSNNIVKGIIFLVHGIGEHIGRYEHVAKRMNENGYLVFGMDHQGHGRSEGDRLFVKSFEHVSDDYLQYIVTVLRSSEKMVTVEGGVRDHVVLNTLPRYILGHSMGGAVTLLVLEKSRMAITWNGVILSGAALQADPAVVTPTLRFLSRMLSLVLPKMPVNKVDASLLSRNPLVCAHFMRDPLVPKSGVTARLATSLLDSMQHCIETMKDVNEPLLVLHGASDLIVNPQGSVDLYAACSSTDVQLKMYPNLYHEILHSEKNEVILMDIVQWMEERLVMMKRSEKI